MNAPFKQRENIELFLKGCESYGLVPQDLFQVNDLYEQVNLDKSRPIWTSLDQFEQFQTSFNQFEQFQTSLNHF